MTAQHWPLRCHTLRRCKAREGGREERANLSVSKSFSGHFCFFHLQSSRHSVRRPRAKEAALRLAAIHPPSSTWSATSGFKTLLIAEEQSTWLEKSGGSVQLCYGFLPLATSHLVAHQIGNWNKNVAHQIRFEMKMLPTRSDPRSRASIARDEDFFPGCCTQTNANHIKTMVVTKFWFTKFYICNQYRWEDKVLLSWSIQMYSMQCNTNVINTNNRKKFCLVGSSVFSHLSFPSQLVILMN